MRLSFCLSVSGLLMSGTCLARSAQAQKTQPQTVQYRATIDTVKYVYGVAPPVAHVRSGNILDANSLDCFGNVIKKPGDTLALIKGDNPLTGPFFIDGAEPGDTLVVHFLDLQVDGDQGLGALGPGFRRAQRDQLHPDACIRRFRKKSGSIPSTTPTTPPRSRPSIQITK